MSLRSSLFLKSTSVAVAYLMVLGALSAASTESKRSTASANASTLELAASPVTQEQASKQDVQGLVIALRPTGFSPPEIEVTDGRYLLVVQNRVRIRDIAFQLDREGGGKLHEVHDRKLQWKKAFDLHPGTYVLSVVGYPKWRCLIKVKPH